jgi:undecaprenyl-diphosphatase
MNMELDPVRATILALIQGLTEFLPISSSAHLILPSAVLGWEDQGLAFDLAVHLGTLLAVAWYFRLQLMQIATDMTGCVFRRTGRDYSGLGWKLAAATLPVVVAGLFLKDLVETTLRDARIIVVTTIGFGLLLWWADRVGSKNESEQEISWKAALLIGVAQVFALVPGTSRSGVTMTAALLCGLGREPASRFSFLLSIPVIGGAALLMVVDLLSLEHVDWFALAYGMGVSAVAAYACIHFFLRLINSIGFLPFVIYRLLLGLTLLLVIH